MKEFKDILLEKRKALGLSQFELGMLLDTSQAVIGKWELGEFYPNFSSLNKIADVFKCSVDELMGRDKPGVNIPMKIGTAYFYDGHTEDIFRYITHKNGDETVIEFYTTNGMYVFQAYIIQNPKVNYITCKECSFRRVVVEVDEYGCVDVRLYTTDDIERIEILKEKER